jgi:hypothetical protein
MQWRRRFQGLPRGLGPSKDCTAHPSASTRWEKAADTGSGPGQGLPVEHFFARMSSSGRTCVQDDTLDEYMQRVRSDLEGLIHKLLEEPWSTREGVTAFLERGELPREFSEVAAFVEDRKVENSLRTGVVIKYPDLAELMDCHQEVVDSLVTISREPNEVGRQAVRVLGGLVQRGLAQGDVLRAAASTNACIVRTEVVAQVVRLDLPEVIDIIDLIAGTSRRSWTSS